MRWLTKSARETEAMLWKCTSLQTLGLMVQPQGTGIIFKTGSMEQDLREHYAITDEDYPDMIKLMGIFVHAASCKKFHTAAEEDKDSVVPRPHLYGGGRIGVTINDYRDPLVERYNRVLRSSASEPGLPSPLARKPLYSSTNPWKTMKILRTFMKMANIMASPTICLLHLWARPNLGQNYISIMTPTLSSSDQNVGSATHCLPPPKVSNTTFKNFQSIDCHSSASDTTLFTAGPSTVATASAGPARSPTMA